MPTIVGIFIFVSREMFSKKEFANASNLRFNSGINFKLNRVEHEISFITSGSGY